MKEKLKLMKLSDRYIKTMLFEELDKVWGERKESVYDLPFPEGIEKQRVVWINPNYEV